jgi:ubiquinone/menaquinone biosynthesis C-methylase UbiE
MTIERLHFGEQRTFNAVEASSHLARYSVARPLCHGKRVLDVACGEGYGAYFMSQHWGAASVDGVDVAPEAIESARSRFEKPGVRFHQHPAEAIDALFEPASFDLIVCLETIEHVDDADTLVAALARQRKPDGTLVISCPNDYWYYPTAEESNPFHKRKFRLAEFQALCERVLGPASRYLYGTPVSGFANLSSDDKLLVPGAGDASPTAMLRPTALPRVELLPSDEDVDERNCSYFVGIWSPGETESATRTAVIFPCSMTASAPAAESLAVTNLRDEVIASRQRLFNARYDPDAMRQEYRAVGLQAAAYRAENELIRAELRRITGETQGQIDAQAAELAARAEHIDQLTETIREKDAVLEEWRRRLQSLDRMKSWVPKPVRGWMKRLLRWK